MATRPQFPRRIAFALPHLRAGGIEAVVRSLVNGLDRQTWAPLLLLNRKDGDFLEDLSSDVPVIGCGGKGLFFRALVQARLFNKHRIELVYSGTNAMNISTALAVLMMPRRLRPKLLISEHTTAANYLSAARRPRIRKALIGALYPSAQVLAAPSIELAREWRDGLGLKGPELACLPNPVLETGALRQLQEKPPRRIPDRIVAVGRLVPDKGHSILIEAFASVCETMPEAELVIYGDGPERGRLNALACRLGVSGKVSLPGYCPNVLQALASASVMALPSLREGFGNVVVEAMAAGTPVVASDCPGPAALLRGGALGRLVQAGDAGALAGAIGAQLRAPRNEEQLARARDAALAYRADNAIEAFEALAENLLCPGTAGPTPAYAQATPPS